MANEKICPRPFPGYHLERFGPEFRRLHCSVKPGLTGFWQVNGRSEADLDAQEALDTYYIRNWLLWLDLVILARTPWAVLFGKGGFLARKTGGRQLVIFHSKTVLDLTRFSGHSYTWVNPRKERFTDAEDKTTVPSGVQVGSGTLGEGG